MAALYQKVLLRSNKPAPTGLASYLKGIFLNHPWQDSDIPSLVYLNASGDIGGFIGVLPVRLLYRNSSLRAAVPGSLMVSDPSANPLAGARLLRSVRAGSQDLCVSETANDVSMGMWEQMGHHALSQYSMQWVRVFQPARFAVAALKDRTRIAQLLKPAGSLVDFAGRRILGASIYKADEKSGKYRREAVEGPELVSALRELSADYLVRPDWDEATLDWLLAHAARKRRHGDMRSHVVLSTGGKTLGCHIYFARSGGIAWVLQILAQPNAGPTVVSSLLDHARQSGCVAVRGRTQPDTVTPLMRQGALFFCNSATVIHARNDELRHAIENGRALITGLAGESWVRLIGDTFE